MSTDKAKTMMIQSLEVISERQNINITVSILCTLLWLSYKLVLCIVYFHWNKYSCSSSLSVSYTQWDDIYRVEKNSDSLHSFNSIYLPLVTVYHTSYLPFLINNNTLQARINQSHYRLLLWQTTQCHSILKVWSLLCTHLS